MSFIRYVYLSEFKFSWDKFSPLLPSRKSGQPIGLVGRCRFKRYFELDLDLIPEFVLIVRAVDGIVNGLDSFLVFRLQIREVARIVNGLGSFLVFSLQIPEVAWIVYVGYICSLPLRFLITFIICKNVLYYVKKEHEVCQQEYQGTS